MKVKKKINTTSDLGPIFKQARLDRGLSLIHVARKAGFSYMTVHNVERNHGSTRTETLLAIASVVGVTIEVSVNPVKGKK